MKNSTAAPRSRASRLTLALAGLLLLALLAPAAGGAAKQPKPKKPKKDAKVTVMTRNLYLGADLGPAISATSICGAIDAGGTILNDVDLSNFPERSKLLAAEIARAKPDLVGLQEAALWRQQTPSDFTGSPATDVRYDFLQLLLDALSVRGADYTAAVVQEEFDQELPANTDHDVNTGNGPFGGNSGPFGCGADKDGRLTMRDVILVRNGGDVKVKNPRMGQFQNLYEVKLGGALPVSVKRGWVSVDAKVKGTKRTRGARFHFVNAHLESFGDPAIREAQARELFAAGGPLVTKEQLVFVGDINSGGPLDKVGTGFTTAGDEGAYNALTKDFGMTDLGARQTCCYPDVFQSAIGDYRLDHTVDHVMAKPRVKQLRSYLTGSDPAVAGAGGVVASDHSGVVSKLKLKRRKKQ